MKLGDEESSKPLVKHALTNRNTNQLTDEDLQLIVVRLGLLQGPPPVPVDDLTTAMMIEALANHYGLNSADCLANFQSTEPDPDNDCLLQDPFAEAAWLRHSVIDSYHQSIT